MTIRREHVRFALRADPAAVLATRNEVPLERELVAETDTRRMKLGDGITAYNDLPYLTAPLQMRVDGGWVQYSPDDGATWYNVITVAALTGPAGPAGGPTQVLTTSGNLALTAADHRGKCLLHSAGVITCPETAAAGFAVDDIVEVRRQSGSVTFNTSGSASLDFNTTLYSAEINSLKDIVLLKVVAADTWALIGPLADV